MSLITDLITALLGSGCTAEQLSVAVRVVEEHEKAQSKIVRDGWKERKRKQRMSQNVTVTSEDNQGQVQKKPYNTTVSQNVSGTLGDPSFSPSMVSPPNHIIEYNTPPSLTSPLSPSFHQFWSAYPRKVGKGQAQKAYAKAIRKAEPEVILARLEVWKASKDFPEIGFVPHASTWLNGERWLDELGDEPPKPKTKAEQDAFLQEHYKRMEELWANEK